MIKVLGTNVAVQIACGGEHSIALTNDGELYAWGSNRDGQLGLGSYTISEIKPKRISALAAVPIAFIACGGYHTVVISKSGKFKLYLHRGYRTISHVSNFSLSFRRSCILMGEKYLRTIRTK